MGQLVSGWEPRCLVAAHEGAEFAIAPSASLPVAPEPEALAHALLRRPVPAPGRALQPWELLATFGSREAAARTLPEGARALGPLLRRVREGKRRSRDQMVKPAPAGSVIWRMPASWGPAKIAQLTPCCAPGETPQAAALTYLLGQVERGEAGRRRNVEGEWRGESSTFPAWFRDRGYSKDEVLRVASRAIEGKPVTRRQGAMLTVLFDGMMRELQEAARSYGVNQPSAGVAIRQPGKLTAWLEETRTDPAADVDYIRRTEWAVVTTEHLGYDVLRAELGEFQAQRAKRYALIHRYIRRYPGQPEAAIPWQIFDTYASREAAMQEIDPRVVVTAEQAHAGPGRSWKGEASPAAQAAIRGKSEREKAARVAEDAEAERRRAHQAAEGAAQLRRDRHRAAWQRYFETNRPAADRYNATVQAIAAVPGLTAKLRELASFRALYDPTVQAETVPALRKAVRLFNVGWARTLRQAGIAPPPVEPGGATENPPRTLDTLSEAIALSSPSGRMSKRARTVADRRLRLQLFGPEGLARPCGPVQPSEAQALRRQAGELRDLAVRGLMPRAYARRADELERRAASLEGPAYAANPPRPRAQLFGSHVVEIRYQHAEDGRFYKHTFGTRSGASMFALPDGSLLIKSSSRPLWQDF